MAQLFAVGSTRLVMAQQQVSLEQTAPDGLAAGQHVQ